MECIKGKTWKTFNNTPSKCNVSIVINYILITTNINKINLKYRIIIICDHLNVYNNLIIKNHTININDESKLTIRYKTIKLDIQA